MYVCATQTIYLPNYSRSLQLTDILFADFPRVRLDRRRQSICAPSMLREVPEENENAADGGAYPAQSSQPASFTFQSGPGQTLGE